MTKDKSIIFICTGNSCRSQIAEGFARAILPKGWKIYSAGVMAGGVHPMTIEAMREVGIDITDQYSKTMEDIPIENIDYVVTLCGSAREQCPVFPRAKANEHWPIDDPLGRADRLAAYKLCREDIRKRMEELAKRINRPLRPSSLACPERSLAITEERGRRVLRPWRKSG